MASSHITSGVVGLSGRVPEVDPEPVLSSSLVLAGEPLPLVGTVRVYTCGITPYDVTHVGHAATFVWADLIGCLARHLGVAAETCRNVTDVDDVLTRAAGERGWEYDEFALTQEFLFDRDMKALKVARPDHTPHARAHVQHVIQLAAALLRTGHAYEHDGHVFFRGDEVMAASGLGEQEALAALRRVRRPGRGRPRVARTTCTCGGRRRPSTRRGRARGAGAVPAGTPSAPRWRGRPSAPASTSWSAART